MNRKEYKTKFNTINLDILSEFRNLSDELDSFNFLISESKSATGRKKLIVERDKIAKQLGLKYPTMKQKVNQSQLQTA